MRELREKAQARTERGKQGARKRWQNAKPMPKQCLTNAQPMLKQCHSESESESKKDKENKQKKKKECAFDLFWNPVIRKMDKGRARLAFEKAKAKTDLTPQELADRYNAHVRAADEIRYSKHPSTWLNAESWEDQDVSEAPVSKPWNDDAEFLDWLKEESPDTSYEDERRFLFKTDYQKHLKQAAS